MIASHHIFVLNLWSEIVRTCEIFQAICVLKFVDCNCSHVRTIASLFYYLLFLECNHSYMQTIASHLIFCLWTAIVCMYERLQVMFILFYCGVQPFVHANDCKSSHILFLDCNRSHVRTIASHVFFKNLWSAIVRTCKQLQVISYFIFGLQSFAHTND